MSILTIPVTDFIRKFGNYAESLPTIEEIVLTRDGRPFATVKATPQEKNRRLLSFFGIWKGTELDDDKLWKEVLTRHNRRHPIKL